MTDAMLFMVLVGRMQLRIFPHVIALFPAPLQAAIRIPVKYINIRIWHDKCWSCGAVSIQPEKNSRPIF
jgi:hypothetical protein